MRLTDVKPWNIPFGDTRVAGKRPLCLPLANIGGNRCRSRAQDDFHVKVEMFMNTVTLIILEISGTGDIMRAPMRSAILLARVILINVSFFYP